MAQPRTPGSRPGSSSAPPPAPAPAHASSSPHLPPLRTSPSSSLLGEAGDDGPPARCRTRLPGGRLRLPPPPLLATVVAGVLALPPFVDHVYRSYEVIGVVNNNGAQNSKNNINIQQPNRTFTNQADGIVEGEEPLSTSPLVSRGHGDVRRRSERSIVVEPFLQL